MKIINIFICSFSERKINDSGKGLRYKRWVNFWKLYQDAYEFKEKNTAQKKAAPIWDRIRNNKDELKTKSVKLNGILF